MAFDVEERHVQAAEALLARRLPEPLRSRLLRNNGGEASSEDDDWQLFPVCDPSDRRRIARTCNHIVKETEFARSRRGFPPNATALGENGDGDLLILREGSDRPEIWNHETNEVIAASISWD